MSSGSERDRPCGLLRQGNKVVGNVCMPEASDVFIKEFNHCYGQLRLEVCEQAAVVVKPNSNPHSFRLPMWFRHVWNAQNTEED